MKKFIISTVGSGTSDINCPIVPNQKTIEDTSLDDRFENDVDEDVTTLANGMTSEEYERHLYKEFLEEMNK